MNIYNLLFISNSIKYAEEFKRICQFNEIINLNGISRGLHDFRIRMSDNIHLVLISDVLTDGTIEDVLHELEAFDVIVFGIITQQSSEAILDSYGISYVYEKDMMPSDIVNFLEESLTSYAPEEETKKTHQKVSQEYVESHQSRFAESHVNSSGNEEDYSHYARAKNVSKSSPIRSYINDESRQDKRNTTMEAYQTMPHNRGVTTIGVLKPKVVCFTSAKGGVGKSALSIEVASCIATRAKEVEVNMSTRGANGDIRAVLVDLNCAFGTIASTLPCVSQLSNPPTLANWIIKIRDKIMKNLSYEDKNELQSQKFPKYADYIHKVSRNALNFTKAEILDLLIQDEKTGLYVLPTISSNFDIHNIEGELVELIIDELSHFFDCVILDTGNNFENLTQTAFYKADEIYVVAQPNTQVCVIIKNLLRDAISGLGIDESKFKLIINHPQTNKQSMSNESIEQSLGIPLVSTVCYDENLLLAHDMGQFYVINNKKKAISKDITLLANQILPLWNVAGKSKSIIQRMFGK